MFFVLEALASGFCGGMDSPFIRGVELFDKVVVDEGCNGLLTSRPCGEGPHGGSLSFSFDLFGGMVGVCLGHSLMGKDSRRESALGR